MYVYAPCTLLALWRPEEASDSLELELQAVLSHSVGAGKETHALL